MNSNPTSLITSIILTTLATSMLPTTAATSCVYINCNVLDSGASCQVNSNGHPFCACSANYTGYYCQISKFKL
jgi:hypothetical protein